MPPLKPALLLVSALLMSACNQASGGVPGTFWEKSLLSIDVHDYPDSSPRLPCEGGLSYDLKSADQHLNGQVKLGEELTTPSGFFRRGAAYTLVAGCLDGDLQEVGRTSLTTTVPVNGTLNFSGRQPEENPYWVSVMFRHDLSKPQSYKQKCSGSSQGTRPPCIEVTF